MRRDKKKILITGISGLLGNNIARYFKHEYEVSGIYFSHVVSIDGIDTQMCDLSQVDNFKKIIADFHPLIIIHCASLINIDLCETDRTLAETTNVLSSKNIVDSIAKRNIKLIYISTDAVYDGSKGNFTEQDDVNPLNYYGITKHDGELEALKKEASLILRTNIFGWNIQDKNSIGEWVLEELKSNRNINGFKDAYFSTIYTFELAIIIGMAIKKDLKGVYNCVSSDLCSKYEFAIKIADRFGFDTGLITPISIDKSNFKVARGKNLSLNVDKMQKALGHKLPTIDQSIEAFHRDYKSGLPEKIRK